MKHVWKLPLLFIIFTVACCGKKKVEETNLTVSAGNDPNFKIVANTDEQLKKCNRKVVVFGIDIYAAPNVDDAKLLHAANIMAQYLDNDEDGKVDNQQVVDKMTENKAFLFMRKTEADYPSDMPSGRMGQDLGNDETNPNYVKDKLKGRFDASLEEVLHIITHAGYSQVYPEIFGETKTSKLAKAMDEARGGHFTSIPNKYPEGAWYTYDDKTCDYNCMLTEYHYWTLTSILGAQATRLSEIDNEWRLNTEELVQTKDKLVYNLLTDPNYMQPTILPDGTYRH